MVLSLYSYLHALVRVLAVLEWSIHWMSPHSSANHLPNYLDQEGVIACYEYKQRSVWHPGGTTHVPPWLIISLMRLPRHAAELDDGSVSGDHASLALDRQ